MENRNRDRSSMRAINIGLVANLLLAGMKTVMGIVGHSPALLSDGINSTSDVAYFIVVRVFMKLSRQPADDEHPFGHSQMESIAALVVGAFVLTTAVAIFWSSINSVYELFSGKETSSGATVGALAVALFTVALKLVLAFYTRIVGRKTGNPAVIAIACDHRNDIFAASAAVIGIALGMMGHVWVDPLAGAVVALVVLRTGIQILRDSSSDLMDTVPGRELQQQVLQLIVTLPGVIDVEEIRAHRFGPYMMLYLTIGIDGDMTVRDGDRIAAGVERLLLHELDSIRQVHIHYHPAKAQDAIPA